MKTANNMFYDSGYLVVKNDSSHIEYRGMGSLGTITYCKENQIFSCTENFFTSDEILACAQLVKEIEEGDWDVRR